MLTLARNEMLTGQKLAITELLNLLVDAEWKIAMRPGIYLVQRGSRAYN